MEENKDLYKMEEVIRITGLTEHTIRNWCREFNIQLEKTGGGHRRFTDENIQLLKSIEEKKEVNGWSMKQIGSWLNGELTPEVIASTEVKTNLEKEFQDFKKVVSEKTDNLAEVISQQTQIILALTKKLDEQAQVHKQQLSEQEQRILDAIEKRLSDPVEKRTQELTNSLNQMLMQRSSEIAAAKEKEILEQEIQKQQEKQGFISKIFSSFKKKA